MKSVDEMVDYARQLRLHTQARRSIHVKLSILEKHLRDERGRRFVAVTLRQLITNYGATMFALPNADVVLVVKGAKVDSIEPLLAHIRKKFRESEALKGLDPVHGQSDRFVSWFDLEEDYVGFRSYIEDLAARLKGGLALAENEGVEETTTAPAAADLETATHAVEEKVSLSKNVKMVPISAPEKDIVTRDLDPELLVAMEKALIAADVGGLMRKQTVMAIIGVQPPQPVMVHRFVPHQVVYEKLLSTKVIDENRWLEGYLSDLLASRLLISAPNMKNDHSIASSLRTSCAAIFDSAFSRFDSSVGVQPRSTVIIEFGATDILTDFRTYKAAVAKLNSLGYRIMVADVDPDALMWLDYKNFEADFVKLQLPSSDVGEWLNLEKEELLLEQITQIGLARVILDGCESQHGIEVGQRLGITLFQGAAVSPITS